MTITPAQIQSASQALRSVLRFDYPADSVLSRYFRDFRELGARDRAFVAEAVYGVLRRKRTLERLCGGGFHPPPGAGLAGPVEGTTLRQLGEGLHGRDTDFFTEIKGREGARCPGRSRRPARLAGRAPARLPEPREVLALAQSLNRPAPLDLRANPSSSTATPSSKAQGRRRRLRAGALLAAGRAPRRQAGAAEAPALPRRQLRGAGRGSQLLGFLLQPKRGEMVVDFCAGAGGKTLLLGALMRNTGRLYAFDVSDKRLSKLKPRMARSGLSNIHPVVIASENDRASSAWPARSTGCWWMRRAAASAPCAATPISSGARAPRRWPSSPSSRRRSWPARRAW
jgi:16S rRNA (cytosine967-C5)-methyltransferase